MGGNEYLLQEEIIILELSQDCLLHTMWGSGGLLFRGTPCHQGYSFTNCFYVCACEWSNECARQINW